MNKKILLYIVSGLAFVLLIVGAVNLYNALGKEYKGNDNYIKPDKQEFLEGNMDSNETEAAENEDNDGETKNDGDENRAVDFTVYNSLGDAVKLSSKFGKPIVLNFWATWCSPCRSELPAFDKMYNKYGDDVEFVMINLDDSIKTVEDFMLKNEYTFPVLYDTDYEASYLYGASSIPLTVIIYADGTLMGGKYGPVEQDELEYYITTALEGTK